MLRQICNYCEHAFESQALVCTVISDGVTDIASEIRQTPDIILNSLGLAFHQVIKHEPNLCLILIA